MAKHLNVTNREVIRSKNDFKDEAARLLQKMSNSLKKPCLETEIKKSIKQEVTFDGSQIQLQETLLKNKNSDENSNIFQNIIKNNNVCLNIQPNFSTNSATLRLQNFNHTI